VIDKGITAAACLEGVTRRTEFLKWVEADLVCVDSSTNVLSVIKAKVQNGHYKA
jgi:hypothetical protein